MLGLLLAELEGGRHEPGPGSRLVLRGPDHGDDGVDHVERLQQAFDDVGPIPGLPEPELRPPSDHIDLVVDIELQHLDQVQRARHAVDEGDGVDAEAGLQRRVLPEVVEHDIGHRVALQHDDQLGLALG